jgi:murein DD-endopeptidase MepM/ murein hydrolase activator NlpD
MPFWSPKRRKYWGYKQNGSSDSTVLEESDSSSSDYTPMPWEPQDSTEDNTMYWKGEDSEEIDLSRETVLPTTVITAERTQPEQSRSLIDQIQGKAPEDINPENFVNRIIMGMLGGQNNSSIPKVIGNNAILGNLISSQAWDGGEGSSSLGQGGEFILSEPSGNQNKVWPSGYIFPIPDSFKIYQFRGFSESHDGIDIVGQISGRILGQPILSVCDGIIDMVVKANELLEGGGKDNNAGGIRVRVKDLSGLYYVYYHLMPGSNQHLEAGQMVSQGDILGNVGSSAKGRFDDQDGGTGIHLHFEMWKGIRIIVDFKDYFPELAEIPKQ